MRGDGFSIIMPAYNAQSTIEESILSVLAQSYDMFELIIVDDGSSDQTRDIVIQYSLKDERIKYILNAVNLGVALSRNVAIESAVYRYITFLDADDLWYPNKLFDQKACFEQGSDLVFSAYTVFDESGDLFDFLPPSSPSYNKLLFRNFIGNLTGAYDSLSLGKIKQLNIGHEDYLMWLQLMKKSKAPVSLKTILAKYRVNNLSLSANKVKAAKWFWSIHRLHLKHSVLTSSFFFSGYVFFSLRKFLLKL